MNRIKFSIIFFFIIISSSISALEPVRSYSEQIDFIENLSSNFTKNIIGNVTYNKTIYPIYKISYNYKENINQKKYLIISGVHGNEPAPVYAIKDFLLELSNKQILDEHLAIDFIYILNPWGFEYNQRSNGDGIDINRDLIAPKSQEIDLFLSSIETSRYDKVFDFHEANSTGFFLYCYGLKNRDSAKKITKLLQNQNVLLEEDYKDLILRAKNGILFVPFYAVIYMNIRKLLTNGLYFHGKGASKVFTFETSKNIQMDERIRINRILLDYILQI